VTDLPPVSHVSYPDDGETVAVVVHGFAGPVPARVAAKLPDVLGDFDVTAEATP
jgi:hypothetical protein